ncbi:MAG: hypothetical protein QUS09_02305, partial [Methanotrichaceae archaeon]|nr:hypothetical protein [Methanotrichaceae archaeon]
MVGSMEKVAKSGEKEGKEAETAGKKTRKSGEDAKHSASLYSQLQKSLDATASKFDSISDKLDPLKGKILAVQASLMGLGTVAVYSSAKTESLVEELKGLKGEAYAAPLLDWAKQGSGKAYTSKSQRLAIATDLSDLNYSTDEIKKYGEEIEKFYFQKTATLKRYGVASAEELARAMASAEKSGNLESVRRFFSSGAVSEEKLNKEMDRLRTNYEKFAFATDEVVKKQALHNLMMKELTKTNQSFTGQATTLEQKLDVLYGKFSGLLSGIGDKIKPTVMMAVDGLVMLIDAVESVPGHDEILAPLGGLLVILTTLATAAMGLAPLFGFLAGAVGVVGAIASAPLLPIVAALALIAAALYLIYTRTTLLQDGYSRMRDLTGKTLATILRLFGLTSSSLKGNKESINELFSLIRNWLDGLIPGWLNDLLAKGEGIYREAMGWFTKIMGWWNDFLGKVTEVYDKVKGIFNLGKGGQEVTPEMQKYGVTGWGSVNGEKAVKVAY